MANYTNHWFYRTDMLGLPISTGIDEIALAFTADAYSRTGRSRVDALSTSAEPIRTRRGLVIITDSLPTPPHSIDRVLPELDTTPAGRWLAKSIDGIAQLYGRNTAYGVALDFEYPMVPSLAPKGIRVISRQ